MMVWVGTSSSMKFKDRWLVLREFLLLWNMRVGWKFHVIYLLLNFLLIGSKHCNTNERSLWTARETVLKNKPHLFTFHESILVRLLTFQPALVDRFDRIALQTEPEKPYPLSHHCYIYDSFEPEISYNSIHIQL